MSELRATVYENEPDRTLRSAQELDELLKRAASEAKSAGRLNIIFLYAPNDDHLSLVVGANETVLGFNYGHGDPPYYASRGDMDGEKPVFIAYVGLEHHTEFSRSWVIPMDLGRRASMEFLETGKRPTVMAWEEV